MAIFFADGFEHYGTAGTATALMVSAGAYASITASPTITTTQARTGARAFTSPSGGFSISGFRYGFPAAKAAVGVAFGLYLNAVPGSDNLQGYSFRDPGNVGKVLFVWQADGSIAVRNGALGSGIELGRTEPILSAGTWNHIEAFVVSDPIVGYVEIRVNGVVELILEDVNTGDGSLGGFGHTAVTDSGPVAYFIDDLVFWDTTGTTNNDFLGPVQVITVFPASTPVNVGFGITGAATGHEAVDETTPDADTTYVSAEETDDVIEFGLPTLPPELISISAIYVAVMAKAQTAGIANYIASIVSGVTAEDGENHPLTTAYTYRGEAFNDDPATSGQWAVADAQAALVRITRVEPVA